MMQDSRTARTTWPAIVALGLAVFMAAIDLTVVATALPAITDSLHAGPTQSQWVVLAYSLPAISLILAAGRWVDGINLRSAFILGVLGFALASAIAGAARSLEVLLAARVAQGVFAALISALILAVAGVVVDPAERGKAF